MHTSAVTPQDPIIKILQNINGLLYGFADMRTIDSRDCGQLPYAISIGLPLTRTVVDNIATGPNQVYYDEYCSINDRLDFITQQIKQEIEKQDYRAYAVASSKRTDFINISGEFPHKTSAVLSGLGWIGKSALLITRQYGPRIRLATVFTDMPLPAKDIREPNYCGTCKKCVESCPAGAIVGNLWAAELPRENLIDVRKCDLWKLANYPQFNGHVCGICVAVCPHGNRKGAASAQPLAQ